MEGPAVSDGDDPLHAEAPRAQTELQDSLLNVLALEDRSLPMASGSSLGEWGDDFATLGIL